MAGWVCLVLCLITQLQSQVNANCNIQWNATLKNSLQLEWSGEERDSDVMVLVTPTITGGDKRECEKQNLTVPFSQKEVLIQPVCSNTSHVITADLVCNNTPAAQTWTFTFFSDDILPPLNLTNVGVTNVSIQLEWHEPIYSEKPIIAYHIRKSKTRDFEMRDIYHTSSTSYDLGGLIPYTNYFIEVRARTETTFGPWSDTISVQTGVGVPFAPVSVTEGTVTNSSIVVKWKEPRPFSGPILFYTIKWGKESDPDPENSTTIETTSYKIEGLDPYTPYSIQVRAITKAGAGPWSSILIVLTDIGVPNIPTGLMAANITARSILLTWNASEPANGPFLEYLVAWGVRGSAISQVLVNDTEFLAEDLLPNTEYAFQVAARTNAGLSSYSGRLYVWTKIDLPSEPLYLTEVEVTNTSITIAWQSPEFPNGPILAYVVQFMEYPNGTLNSTEIAETVITLTSMKPNTTYAIRVCARTEGGVGPCTDFLEVQTDEGVPGPLTDVSSKVNETSILVTWLPPEYVPGTLQDYSVSWGVRGTSASLVVVANDVLSYAALGLRPYTEYFFRIAARTQAGAGVPENITLRTDIATPSIPRSLTATEETDVSIFLEWLPPEHPNGPYLEYKVKWLQANTSKVAYSRNINSTSFNITNLEPSSTYQIQVVAMTSAGKGPLSLILNASTKESGTIQKRIPWLAIGLGISIPLLIIILVIGLIIARRQGFFERPRRRTLSTSPSVPAPRQNVQMEVVRKSHTFTVHNFEEKMNEITRYGRSGFIHEFEDLAKDSPSFPCDTAKREDNLIKNRWVKILPYDYTRIKLHSDASGPRPTFINANYIQGDSHIQEYIATQGPLPNTINDFWTLVWQQYVPVIVMLTQCVERAIKNCEKYWPSLGETKLYGDIRVQTQSENVLTTHILRVFLLQQNDHQRQVVHMHFTNWPVSGCPRSPEDFLHFVRLVRNQISDRRPGPTLVHCSAGVGRTGTFIAVDRIMQHIQHKEEIDVYGTVLEMRRYRAHMVHSVDQYIFIYSCIQQMIQDRKESQENIYDTIA